MRSAPLTVLPLLIAVPAVANPYGLRLTEAADPATTIAISWNSDDAGDAEVLYGPRPDALTQTATATPGAMPAPLGTSFSVVLTGLQPLTTYYYRVGRPGRLAPPDEAPPASFTTLDDDPCGALRFVVLGDDRANVNFGSPGVSDFYPAILGEALAADPQLFVNTGDMVKNGAFPEEWNNLLLASEAVWSRIPSITTVGNHDTGDPDGDGALYNRLFALPVNEATAVKDDYSIDVGPIHFVSLNSQHTDSTELPEMAAWLDADLAATTQRRKIVFFHQAIYSRGNHSTGEEDGGILNRTLVPIFDAHGVDLVLNGHTHDYERCVPSRGVDAAFGGAGRDLVLGDKDVVAARAELPDGSTGTHCVVSGGGGARTTDIPLFDDLACVDTG